MDKTNQLKGFFSTINEFFSKLAGSLPTVYQKMVGQTLTPLTII